MSDPLRDKLADEVDEATWRDLAPHQARGALLLCDARCEIVEVATALARDEVSRVSEWLQSGAIRKPEEVEAAAFDPARRFRFVIVRPFVVAAASPPKTEEGRP